MKIRSVAIAVSAVAGASCTLSFDTSTVISAVSTFDYDVTGLPTFPGAPSDALGRATHVAGATLGYGADGALARATRGDDVFDYITDEDGHRLAKRVNGEFVEAYVEEGLVTETTLYVPVRINGLVVGITHDGVFESLATDARGTLLADGNGVTRAEAYGERDRVSPVGRAIDYAQSGRDTDLGVIRMGVRDYDPATHRFLTPDPLFFLHPDKCITDPIECNLYSYARDRPADYIDPAGTDVLPLNYVERAAAPSMDPSDYPTTSWTLTSQLAHNDANLAAHGVWGDDASVRATLETQRHEQWVAAAQQDFARNGHFDLKNATQDRIGADEGTSTRINPADVAVQQLKLATGAGAVGSLAMIPMAGWLAAHPDAYIPKSFYGGLAMATLGDTIASFDRRLQQGKEAHQEIWKQHEQLRGGSDPISPPPEHVSHVP